MTSGMVQAGEAAGGTGSLAPPPTLDDPLPGTAASPTGRIRRGLMAMALCWQALVMGPDPAFWPWAAPDTWRAALLWLAWTSWLAMLVLFAASRLPIAGRLPFAGRLGIKVADAAFLSSAGLALLVQAAGGQPSPAQFAAGASLVNVGVGIAGMLLPATLARWFIGIVIGLEALVVAFGWQGGAWSASEALLYPLYAMAIGAGGQGARQALLRVADRHERSIDQIRRAQVRSVAVARVRREMSRQERLIHESVLNTLAAIARGGLPQDDRIIRREAAASAAVLREATQDRVGEVMPLTGHWVQDLGPHLDQMRARGIEVQVQAPTALQMDMHTRLDPQTYDALLVGTREALANVERHARARHAVVAIAELGGRGLAPTLQVSVRDDGVGFDPGATELGFGLGSSIEGTMAEVGGTASVRSALDHGTEIRLAVPIPAWARQGALRRLSTASRAQQQASEAIPMGNAAFARPVLAWFGVFVLVSALVTLDQDVEPMRALGALALVGGLGAGLWLLSARPLLPGWFVLVTAVLAPVAYRVQMGAVPSPPATHWQDWASEALAVLWLVVTAVGPWWTVLVALASWLATQGDPLHELLQPGTAIILAGALFARSVRRNGRAFAAAEQRRTQELARAVADAQGLERMRARRELMGQTNGLALLQGVADGRLLPTDPAVQHDCARQERFIRSVMRLDPGADLVHRRAGQVAVRAYHLGLDVDISLDQTEGWPRLACERFFGQVGRMIELADSHAVARLTARREGEALVMRFVAGGGLEVIEVRHV